MAWRVIAQRILTGDLVDTNVPMTGPVRRDLSGPGAFTGTVNAEYAGRYALDGKRLFIPWNTALFVEVAGQIRWGGIVVSASLLESAGLWQVDASGYASYPQGIPFYDTYTPGVVDVLDVVRRIWEHVQSWPDGDLGVVVDSHDAKVRIGTAKEPYKIGWWELRDCGQEIDTLARSKGFDYREEHNWVDNQTRIEHRLRLGDPRFGRRRQDLTFTAGENITSPVLPELVEGVDANEIVLIGKGQGRKTVHARVPRRDGRLRRVHTHTDKTIESADRLREMGRSMLADRTEEPRVARIEVKNHPNAPLWSWQPGDLVQVQANVPGYGRYAEWHRVVSDEIRADGTAGIDLVDPEAATPVAGADEDTGADGEEEATE